MLGQRPRKYLAVIQHYQNQCDDDPLRLRLTIIKISIYEKQMRRVNDTDELSVNR